MWIVPKNKNILILSFFQHPYTFWLCQELKMTECLFLFPAWVLSISGLSQVSLCQSMWSEHAEGDDQSMKVVVIRAKRATDRALKEASKKASKGLQIEPDWEPNCNDQYDLKAQAESKLRASWEQAEG